MSKPEYVTVREAAERLGKGYSRSSILRRIETKEWKEGVHWIDDRREGTTKRLIRINLTAIEDWRSRPAAKR